MTAFEDMINEMVIDLKGTQDNSSSSPEIFDAIKVPAEEEIGITDTLSDPVEDVPGGIVGTSIVGFFEIISGD